MKKIFINSPILRKISNTGLGILKNRYSATALIGLFWVMFISDIDLFYIAKEQSKLLEMRVDVESTIFKNDELRLQLEEIEKNPAVLERVARERYFMKRPEEDVFRIVE
jgi:cell division protein DivIC